MQTRGHDIVSCHLTLTTSLHYLVKSVSRTEHVDICGREVMSVSVGRVALDHLQVGTEAAFTAVTRRRSTSTARLADVADAQFTTVARHRQLRRQTTRYINQRRTPIRRLTTLSRARHQPGGHVTSRPGGGAVW